jgi:DNA-binding transcriptional ArsR family regulator
MNRKRSRTVSQDEPSGWTDADRLDAVGEATRRAILDLLRARPSSVAELARQLPVSRPAVSQHLRVLKDAGMVRVEARGTQRIYSLDPEGTRQLHRYVTSLWDAALANFDQSATRSATSSKAAR